MWYQYPPAAFNTTSPYYWMRYANAYPGIAYDKFRDVLYVLDIGKDYQGSLRMKIHAWEPETGVIATRISPPQGGTPGEIKTTGIQGGYTIPNTYHYWMYRIELDDDGRIYVCSVYAPDGTSVLRVYRWDDQNDDPYVIFSGAPNPFAMSGTSMAVIGGMKTFQNQPIDSTRLYISGAKFVDGWLPIENTVYLFMRTSTMQNPPQFGIVLSMVHNQQNSGFAGHGIAPTGPFPNSTLYVDSNFGETLLENQGSIMSFNKALDPNVTSKAGPIKYFRDTLHQKQYLILADGFPTSEDVAEFNNNTTARVIDLTQNPPALWPSVPTPPLGSNRHNNLGQTKDNWGADVDYKVWVHPDSGTRHLQVFVMISNNGIASFRTRAPLQIPVEMTTFRGNVANDNVHLSWQIAYEYNNKGFEVYRSFNNGQDWEKIGFVEGRGSSNSTAEYSYDDPITDIHTNIGSIQYRLKQVDFDGTYEWTSAVDVFLGDAPAQPVLYQNYPNPFNPSTKISYQLHQSANVTLSVYNSLGDEVTVLAKGLMDAGLHVAEFDGKDLPSGTYVYP
jgi:hypothetical protein